MRTRSFDYAAIRESYDGTPASSTAAKCRAVATLHGCSIPTVIRAIKLSDTSASSKTTMGPGRLGGARSAHVLPVDHPATVERRTLFPSMVFAVGGERVLKPGENSEKIGGRIVKGPWKGFPVYTLTLEERATCPFSCRHWGSCYGNNTPFARRWRHGDALEWRLEREVPALELASPAGFAVRLHGLGDFYSVGYVRLWRRLLERHPALHVWGYTAHVDSRDDEIAYELAMTVRELWPRFAMRFSNGESRKCSTVTIENPVSKPADAVICPVQWTASGKKSESCSTCGLCWQTTKRIAFLQH